MNQDLLTIANIIGIKYKPTYPRISDYLYRIYKTLNFNLQINSLSEKVLFAQKIVNEEGQNSLLHMTNTICAPKKKREYKIRPTLKGARITEAAPNGVRYSFGPIWCDSVKKGEGICYAKMNEEKLIFHAHYVSKIPYDAVKQMEPKQLVEIIAKTL